MKPIHKHIGRRLSTYKRHFTKYLYEKDTIFATIWVFIFIGVLAFQPINFYFFNPLKLALQDFQLNDITTSKLGRGTDTLQREIVIVNIGAADREGIAYIIDQVGSMKPKVIGLDAIFYSEKDPYQDSILAAVLERHPNLVLANKLSLSGPSGDTITPTGTFFPTAARYGYANLFSDSLTTTRYFYPVQKDYAGNTYPFFATAILEQYDRDAYQYLRKRNKEKEIINYSRRVDQFQVIEPEDLFAGNVEASAIAGKIALLGYVSRNPYDIEDKFFTPMNERFIGKAYPDMNGIVVHANILSMALERNYIKNLPSWVNVLAAVLICWLHMSFFIRYYLENHIWFHLVAKIAQLVSAIVFAFLGMMLLEWFNIQLDMKLSLIVIVLAVDIIYFYEAFAVWMHKKFNYHTVFHQKHH